MRTTSSNLGTPSQPSVGMANPAEIDGLGGTEPTKRKSKCARLGYFHSQPPAAVLNRHGRHGAIRLIPFFVHVSPAEGYGGLRPGRGTRGPPHPPPGRATPHAPRPAPPHTPPPPS